MGSHVASKTGSCCARVVTLSTNKGLLSAVNSIVYFQLGRSVARIAALLATVTFLCNRMKIIDFKLAGHSKVSLLYRGC